MQGKFISPVVRSTVLVLTRAGFNPSEAFRILRDAGERVSLRTAYRIASEAELRLDGGTTAWTDEQQ